MIVWDIEESVRVPAWVVDIHSFRRWIDSEDFPEDGEISWIKGEVWIDMSQEQIFTHLEVKGEYYAVLRTMAKAEKKGLVIPDGLLLSNFAADISGNPDLTFVSTKTRQSDRIRLIEGKKGGYVEIQGTPDMVLEVVSRGSVKKDTVALMKAYWEAGIPEYWVVDVRRDPIRFDIFKHGPKGYVATRRLKGWVRSEVFGKSFCLTKTEPFPDQPEFDLAVR